MCQVRGVYIYIYYIYIHEYISVGVKQYYTCGLRRATSDVYSSLFCRPGRQHRRLSS